MEDKNFSPSNATQAPEDRRYYIEALPYPQMSPDRREYLKAFLLSRRKFKSVIKSVKGNFGKYEDLEEVYEAAEEALWDNNIVIEHFCTPLLEQLAELLHTRLTHTLSGQYITDICVLKCEKPGNQARGTALTYAKRYALKNLFGIASKDDDCADEQKYIENKTTTTGYVKKEPYKSNYTSRPVVVDPKPAPASIAVPTITQEQMEQLEDALDGHPKIYENLKAAYKIKELSELPKSIFSNAFMDKLKEKIKAESA